MINLDSYNALSADQREKFDRAGADLTNYFAYRAPLANEKQLQMLLDGGMEIVEPHATTFPTFRALAKDVYQDWVDSVNDPLVTKLMRDLGAID